MVLFLINNNGRFAFLEQARELSCSASVVSRELSRLVSAHGRELDAGSAAHAYTSRAHIMDL